MTLHGPNGRYTNDVKIAEAVAQMLTRVGIETSIETLPPAMFFTRASAGAGGLPEFSLHPGRLERPTPARRRAR